MPRSATRLVLALLLIAVGAVIAVPALSAQEPEGGLAYSIELSGSIDPATEGWIEQALGEADEQGAELVIIRLDTPGGLVDSMREIVQDIIAAPQPVVVYVSPDGARAASAGLFVTEAGDVAAMAPQTNIGSATPISIGVGDTDEVLGRKVENDAAAYVRALAEGHGRNAELAEEMVREATNVTATEALEADLVDIVASSQEELLVALDGFEVSGPKVQILETEGLEIENRDMPLQFQLLQLIVNPNISFLLILLGLAGLAIEIFNPGAIVPGALGGISLLLGLYGTAQVPVEIAGVLLLLLAVALIIAETQVPSGILGGAGVIALAAGGLLLYDTSGEGFGISPVVVIVLAVVFGVGLIFVARKVQQARRNPVRTGWEELVGAEAVVREPLDPVGQVFVQGALWRARPPAEQEPIELGDRVVVESVDGLTLNVSRLGGGGEDTDSEAGPKGAEA
jgi:membrane-bound serine protease (ClpP class)